MGAALPGAGDVVAASRSTKGVITLDSADQTNADTLPEWAAIAITITGDDNVTVFEVGGNAYVFRRQWGLIT